MLTINGKPELVVMDARAWQDVLDEIKFSRTVAGIRKGLEQVRRGEGIEAEAFFRKLKKKSKA